MAPRLRPAGGSRTLGWAAAGRAGHACSRRESSQPGVARARVAPGGQEGRRHSPMVRLGMLARMRRVVESPGCCSPCPGSSQAEAEASGGARWAGWPGDGGRMWAVRAGVLRAQRLGAHPGICPPCSTPSLGMLLCVPKGWCSLVPRVLCLWQRCEPQLGLQTGGSPGYTHCPHPTPAVTAVLYLCPSPAAPALCPPLPSCSAPG